jgi:hypothetical protein
LVFILGESDFKKKIGSDFAAAAAAIVLRFLSIYPSIHLSV